MTEHTCAPAEEETINEETKNWPIDPKLCDKLDLIKPSHRAIPLRVYQHDMFIEPSNVNSALRNAEIEIQFSVHHVFLKNQTPPRDSFRANIEQIIILRSGKGLQSSDYSKIDPRSGPIAASTKRLMTGTSSEKEHVRKRSKTVDEEELISHKDTEKQTTSKGKDKEVGITDEEED